jgi:hypothetical protein
MVLPVNFLCNTRHLLVLHHASVELLALKVEKRINLIDLRQLLAFIAIQSYDKIFELFGIVQQVLPVLKPILMLLRTC